MKHHFLLDVLEWAERQPKGFTYKELKFSQKFENWQWLILDDYFKNAAANYSGKLKPNVRHILETIFYAIEGGGSDHMDDKYKYVLTSDALFKYIDYLELKEARKNAKEAKLLAIAAIIIALVIPLIIAFKMTQTVQLDKNQFEELNNSLNPILDSGSAPGMTEPQDGLQ